MLSHPTFRNLTDSFECWAHRNGYHRHLLALERRRFLERYPSPSNKSAYHLTEPGRIRALGGRDPTVCWSRPWDGCWRLAVFDLPVSKDSVRRRLLRYLRAQHLGRLQKSVWITPHALDTELCLRAIRGVPPECLMLLQAHPYGPAANRDIARLAWDFDRINRLYENYLVVLETRPEEGFLSQASADTIRYWAAKEGAAWIEAVSEDPMLPQELLPANYLGQKAWQARLDLGRQTPESSCPTGRPLAQTQEG